MQGGAAETSPRQQGWGMPARPHACKAGRLIPTTRTAGSELTTITSSLPETERERKPLALLAGGASLDLMCEVSDESSPVKASVSWSWQATGMLVQMLGFRNTVSCMNCKVYAEASPPAIM